MKYFVTLNGRTWEVAVDGDQVTVGGVKHRADLRLVSDTPLQLLVLDGVSRVLPMESGGRGAWTVLEQGERFEVEALDERAAHVRSLMGTGAGKSGPSTLKAPMPGLVVRVLVEPGQQVAAGASLVVLEAMKMENDLKAAAPGTIERIGVAAGQKVEKGQVLLTFAAAK